MMENKSEYCGILFKFQILTFFIVVSNFVHIHGTFNMIDVKKSKIIQNPTGRSGDYFGYSVAFVQQGTQKSILVGAPKSSSINQPTVTRPGALYKCTSTTSCNEVKVDITGNIQQTVGGRQLHHHKDNGWLGVSLDVSAAVLVCAHRWIDQLDFQTTSQGDYYMDGFCYELNNELERVTQTPFLDVRGNASAPSYFDNAAMGMSAVYSKTTEVLLLGAPGLNQYAGGIVKVGRNQNKYANPMDPIKNSDLYGYAVISGHYYGGNTPYIAIGGPRDDLTGKVMIKTEGYVTKQIITGDQVGSYFGAVLCTVVHKDFGDMLLVGAPLYASVNTQTLTSDTEEGQVYVYIKEGSELVLRQVLSGSNTANARFGSAIADIQDINRDSYNDVAIGAPFEDGGKGVVYIYNGYSGSSGIWPKFNQRITARELGTTLSSFGSVISRNQLAYTNDSYQDILVGAYMSDAAVLLVASPPITMDVKSTVSKTVIDKDADKQFALQVCFAYTGSTDLPSDVLVEFTVNADVERTKQSKVQRVYFVVQGQRKFSVTNQKRIFKAFEKTCYDPSYTVNTSASIVDIVTPIHFEIEYKIIGTERGTNAIINRFDGRRQNPTEDKVIIAAEFKKEGCGSENVCDADLTTKAGISYNFGSDSLLIGEKAGFSLDITIDNNGEPSYDTQVIIIFPVYITYQQYKQVTGDGLLTCSPGYNQTMDMNTVECGISKPLLGGRSFRFNVKLDASDATTQEEGFDVMIKANTRSIDVNQGNNDVVLPVKIKSKADLVLNSISSPEIFVTKANVGKWQVLQHRFDLENKGPSPLVSGTMFKIYFPFVTVNKNRNLYMNQSLISVTNGNITKVDCGTSLVRRVQGSSSSSSTTYRVIPTTNSNQQTNTLSKDCANEKCEFMSCQVYPIPEQSTVSISLTFMMASDIFSTLKAGNDQLKSVNIVSKVMVTLPGDQRLERDSLEMGSSTGTEVLPSEPIAETFEWWKIFLCVLAGIAIIGIIVFIAWKCGFFRRKSKEELEKKQKETAEQKALIQDPGTGDEATFEKPEHLEDEPMSVVINESYAGPIDDTFGSNDRKSLVDKPPIEETDIRAEVDLDDTKKLTPEETEDDVVKMIEEEENKLKKTKKNAEDTEKLVTENENEK